MGLLGKEKKGWIKTWAAAIALALPLCGCTDAIPEMKEGDMELVEEYAAKLLLKYDANYVPTTMNEKEFEQEVETMRRRASVQAQIAIQKAQEEATKGEKEAESSSGSEGGTSEAKQPVSQDIDEFFGLEGFDITFQDHVVTKAYPEETQNNDWQGVARAKDGNSLVVFRFRIDNVSGADALLDMASINSRFTFKVQTAEGTVSKPALTTLLTDDLVMYRDTIPAGESRTAVLIIEMDEISASGITGARMIMKNDTERGETDLF